MFSKGVECLLGEHSGIVDQSVTVIKILFTQTLLSNGSVLIDDGILIAGIFPSCAGIHDLPFPIHIGIIDRPHVVISVNAAILMTGGIPVNVDSSF